MKYAGILLSAYLLLPFLGLSQNGSSCASPYQIYLDGVLRTYATSSNTGAAVVCTTYTSISPVTWFAFTTNDQAECPLMTITASDGAECEIALYTSCNGNNLEAPSSMCFDDGTGLWAPSETYTVTANKTYYLRIKTQSMGNITISGQNHTPANDICEGATSIGTTAITDNNSCHHGGPVVTPGQLCAFTLENTAFYQFYVASTGSSIINITDISCDNSIVENNSGFQIGFFKGSCSNLVPLNCTNGSGTFVQATTEPLDAGTKVYVAIDGINGSNCRYSLTGINVYNVLEASDFKNFSAWQTPVSTVLKWTNSTDSCTYDIERSPSGNGFNSIGRIKESAETITEKTYSFEDKNPLPVTFYRIKQTKRNGKVSVSRTIRVAFKGSNEVQLNFVNPVINNLDIQLETGFSGPLSYTILSYTGQVYSKGVVNCSIGNNRITKDVSSLPPGKYYVEIDSKELHTSKSFVKMY